MLCAHAITTKWYLITYQARISTVIVPLTVSNINTWFCRCSAAIRIKDVTQSSICHEREKIILATRLTIKCAAVTFGINKWPCSFILFLQLSCMYICKIHVLTILMADSRFAPSRWETTLFCNDVSHWLDASLESALNFQWMWWCYSNRVIAQVQRYVIYFADTLNWYLQFIFIIMCAI